MFDMFYGHHICCSVIVRFAESWVLDLAYKSQGKNLKRDFLLRMWFCLIFPHTVLVALEPVAPLLLCFFCLWLEDVAFPAKQLLVFPGDLSERIQWNYRFKGRPRGLWQLQQRFGERQGVALCRRQEGGLKMEYKGIGEKLWRFRAC